MSYVKKVGDRNYSDLIGRLYPYEGHLDHEEALTRHITFQVTDDCPCSCTYCYQGHKGHRMMSKEVAKRGVDLLFEMYDRDEGTFINKKTKAIVLDFIGGEPLMNIEIIDFICEYFMTQCLIRNHPWLYTWRASMISNGALYFDPRVQKYLQKFKGFVSFGITIDGPKEVHDACRVYHDGTGNFDDAYAAMVHYRDNFDPEPDTKVTLSPENIHNMNKIVQFFREQGAKLIHANCAFEPEYTVEHAQVFYRELKKMADSLLEMHDETYISLFQDDDFCPLPEDYNENWCGGTGGMLAFDPDGLAYPCLRYMPTSLGPGIKPLICGSVDGIFEEPDHKTLKDYLDSITRRSQSTDECWNCPIAKGCAWCFKAGTKIMTPDGEVPIENLKIGDKVITGSGKVEVVENVMTRLADKTLSVKATGVDTIYTTPEHPFWVKKFHRSGNNLLYREPQWVEAKDICKSDKIGIYVPSLGTKHIDSNVAYLLGRYVGDGWKVRDSRSSKENYRYYICCDQHETDELEKYFEQAKITYCKDKATRTAQQYNIHKTNHYDDSNNELLISLFDEAGQYAHGKRIPELLFDCDKDTIEWFIKGYTDADGYWDVTKNGFKVNTVSEKLSKDLVRILRMIGINPCVSCRVPTTDTIQNRKVSTRQSFEIDWVVDPKHRYYEFDPSSNTMWVNVRCVQEEDPYTVYNLTVSNEHTFLANSVIVHNCSGWNYQLFGTPNKRCTNICIMHKARSLANVYYWNKWYRINEEPDRRMKMWLPKEEALKIIDEEEYEMLRRLSEE